MATTSRIRGLVQEKLAGRKIDVVGFVDQLLGTEFGEIRCCVATENSLQFACGRDTCEVELDAAQSKLRMLCARLSVLCHGVGVSPYSGEGTIASPGSPGAEWLVRFTNRPDEQEFTLRLLTPRPSSPSASDANGAVVHSPLET